MKRYVTNWIALAAVISLLAAFGTYAADLQGRVTSSSGATATVALDGDLVPQVGDDAKIFFKLPGGDDEVLVGKGKVTAVNGDTASVTMDDTGTKPQKDQLARINSADPKPKSAARAEATSSPTAEVSRSSTQGEQGRDPSFAILDLDALFRNHAKTKWSEDQINERKAAAKKEYDAKAAAYQKLVDAANAAKGSAREKKLANAKTMEREIKEWTAAREKELQDLAANRRAEIVAEILRASRSAGAKVNFLFDASGMNLNGVPLLMVWPREGDMTTRLAPALSGGQTAAFTPLRALKIITVDMNRIFKSLGETKEAETQMNAAREVARKEYDRKTDAYKTLLEAANSARGAAREEQTQKVKALEREMSEFRTSGERELQAQALKLRQGIVAKITAAVSKVSSKEPQALVFESSGNSLNGVPVLLWSAGLPDISDEVIAILNGGDAAGTTGPKTSGIVSSALRFGCVDLDRAFKAAPEFKQADSAKLRAVVDEIARAGDFAIVFDSSANSLNATPLIIATTDAPDLTDAVIAKLVSH